jgi:uncharacterized protein YqgV (UPF0045/DUF77 family)
MTDSSPQRFSPEALHLEFTVEPFVEHEPGPHVVAAIDAARTTGAFKEVDVDVGPFGTSVQGDPEAVLAAASAVLTEAFANGASRVVLQVSTNPD